MNNDDRLFKFILKCNRNKNQPDMHSFMINIDGGKAFVDCREDGIFIETFQGDKRTQFVGNPISVTNRLEAFNAEYETIDI